jgi:hypothetical protein
MAKAVPEDDGIRDLHHRGLEVNREQNIFSFGSCDLRGQELTQCRDAHDRSIDDLAGQHGH